MVTLHPAVIYFRGLDNELRHESHVYLSDVLSHNASIVICIIDKLMKVVKTLVQDLECVHFWTDSPSSQYRNKTIFDLVGRFPMVYRVLASWQYFESGHGKGPCDGIGGIAKRNAVNAVKQGKIIQDASDFYSWAVMNEKGIKYDFVTEEEYEMKKVAVEKRNDEIKTIKGTMSVHSVVGIEDEKIAVRNTTCVCGDCFSSTVKFNVYSVCGWERKSIVEKQVTNPGLRLLGKNEKKNNDCSEARDVSVDGPQHSNSASDIAKVSVGNFVLVQYDDERFCGKIMKVENQSVHVSFMQQCEKAMGKFEWPVNEDIDEVEFDEIIRVIEEPMPTSKSGRMFSFPDYVLDMLER